MVTRPCLSCSFGVVKCNECDEGHAEPTTAIKHNVCNKRKVSLIQVPIMWKIYEVLRKSATKGCSPVIKICFAFLKVPHLILASYTLPAMLIDDVP